MMGLRGLWGLSILGSLVVVFEAFGTCRGLTI